MFGALTLRNDIAGWSSVELLHASLTSYLHLYEPESGPPPRTTITAPYTIR